LITLCHQSPGKLAAMPLTVSHAAAALPVHWLTRGRLPLVALMLGSMSPDFAYFLPGDAARSSTHSIEAVFTFCWPVALLAWVFYVLVLERPTLALLPEAWRPRFPASDRISPKSLLMASVGVIFGAFTHLVWDAFTHANTAVTHNVPFFHTVLYSSESYRLTTFRLLQHLSTLLGLAAIAYWASRLVFQKFPARSFIHEALPPVTNTDRWFTVLFITGISALMALVYHALNPATWIEAQLFYLAVGGMIGAALAWTLVAISIGNRGRPRRVFIRPGAE
jgi:hypothetical protein